MIAASQLTAEVKRRFTEFHADGGFRSRVIGKLVDFIA
jgi:hypothetical protein